MSVDVESGPSPCETREIHSRLMKCALAVEESRAYWQYGQPEDNRPVAQVAFEEYWFGAKSLPWVRVIISNMRARFDAFPEAFGVLRRWREMAPETRTGRWCMVRPRKRSGVEVADDHAVTAKDCAVPSANILFSTVHPTLASRCCASNPFARRLPPRIRLYRRNVPSTRACCR